MAYNLSLDEQVASPTAYRLEVELLLQSNNEQEQMEFFHQALIDRLKNKPETISLANMTSKQFKPSLNCFMQ